MDKRKLQKITQDYLETIANASDFNYADEDRTIPLPQVYVMLEAIKTEPPKANEKRDELPPTVERRQSAGLGGPVETAQKTRHSPVLLSKILNENNHLVILGEPGAGKTTTINFIGLCFAKQAQGWAEENLQTREKRVPVKLQLQVYSSHITSRGAQLISALASEVSSRLQTIPQEECEELIKKWLETGNLLVLLDGLDEVQENRADVINNIRQFAESPAGKSARIVLTSRLAGYVTQGGTFKEYTLKPLQTDKEAQSFLQGWLSSQKPEWRDEIKQKSEELLRQLQDQPALRRLMNNPLTLRMAAQQYARDEKIARNRAQLYKEYVEEAWQRALRRGAQEASKKDAMAVLEALAWQSQMGEGFKEEDAVAILQEKQLNLANEESKAKELFDLVRVKMGILVLVEQKFVFSHTTFREFFVAGKLHRAWKNGKDGQRLTWRFLRPRLHLSAWRESLLLFSSLLDNEKETIDFIERIYFAKSLYESQLYRDFLLAALIIGENDTHLPNLIKRYVKLLGNWERSYEAINALRIIGSRSLPFLIQALRDKKSSLRRNAARALGEMGDPQVIPALIQALEDEDKSVRWEAAKGLGQLSNPHAIPAMVQALEDEDGHVRAEASRALGQIGDPQAIPVLIQALKDKDNFVRMNAASALGKIGDIQAIPALIQALDDEDHFVRSDVVGALGQIGLPAIPAIVQILEDGDVDVRRHAVDILHKISIPAIPVLIQTLKNEEVDIREKAARALGRIGVPAIPALIQALEDEDKSVHWYAAIALGEIVDPQAISAVRQILEDGDDDARWNAAQALGEIGDPQAIPPLMQALEDENRFVRFRAAEALGQIGDPQAIPALIQALKDGYRIVREAAAGALGEIGDPQAIPALLQALADEDKSVRWNAAIALGQLGDSRAIPVLTKTIEEGDRSIRWEAAIALCQLGNPNAISALILSLEDKNEFDRSYYLFLLSEIGIPAIPALIQALENGEGEVRGSAASALGQIGNSQAIPALILALRDEDPDVRGAAAQALGEIGDPQVIPVLIQDLKNQNSRRVFDPARALHQISQRWRIAIIPKERVIQIQTLRKVAEALSKAQESFMLVDVLELLETLTAPQFDPLNPPPPPWWKTSMAEISKPAIIVIMTVVIGLLTVLSGPIKKAIEINPTLNEWVAKQPIGFLIVIFIGIGTVLATLSLLLDRQKKQ